jgi:hypothetical protein
MKQNCDITTSGENCFNPTGMELEGYENEGTYRSLNIHSKIKEAGF